VTVLRPVSLGWLEVVLAGCVHPTEPDGVVVRVADDAELDVVRAFLGTIGDDRLAAVSASDPLPSGELLVQVAADPSLAPESFRATLDDAGIAVVGGDRLGRLYGLTHALEALGWRFHHPHDTFRPAALALPDALDGDGEVQAPEVAERGLHLHTLHPIEGMFDLWETHEGGLGRAEEVVDWVVRNRGDLLQWVALQDVLEDPARLAAWREHSAAINAAADLRGLRTGLGIQLFGSGNLQLAFDLVDDAETLDDARAEMGPRLDAIAGLGFDVVQLSFGEFFGADPQTFVDSVELVHDEVHAREPDAELTAVLHVGDDLKVEYDGKEMLYYFLATYADRPLKPMVHSVMYYDLFEDAGGAYGHDAFTEHRQLLLDRIEADEPVGYYPESAYWIAFDDSIPQYLPLYVRSRWQDLEGIAAASGGDRSALPSHVLFSSGWEWGYWLHDTATLRMGWRQPASPCDAVRFELGAHPGGDDVAELVCRLTDVQHDALIGQRLAPYLASYDAIMEVGYGLGIVSQPRRPLFPELVALTGEDLDAYATTVDQLHAFADAVAALDDELGALDLADDPWLAEVRDGFAIDRARTAFAAAVAEAALHGARGEDATDALAAAATARADARGVVDRRHAALHDPLPERLRVRADNATLYDYGYLIRADELCFWGRELAAVTNVVVEGSALEVPGCGL
jgi:hypothetical protein